MKMIHVFSSKDVKQPVGSTTQAAAGSTTQAASGSAIVGQPSQQAIGGSSSKDCVSFKAAICKRGRSSKQRITQSVHAVQDNDDLLIEILLLLPVISLLQLKSVCKRWLSLISNPTFTLRRSQIPTLDPPCGLLIRQYLCSGYKYRFFLFDTRITCKRFALKNPFTFGSGELHDAWILQSCNGLLLLCRGNTKATKYYVYNPCINLIKMLPRCSIETVKYGVSGTKIAFDPRKSPHYKVIHAVYVLGADDGIYRNRLHIQRATYSSETDMWSVYSSRYEQHPFLGFGSGIYWNDAIYWHNKRFMHDPLLIKLDINVEHQTLTTIETPRTLDGKVSDFELFETCGRLLLLCRKDGNPLLMVIYEMKKGYSEWLVKYNVNLNDDFSCPRRSWTKPFVYSIVLGEREDDSSIVIKDSTKIFQYKPVLKTSQDLYDLKSRGGFDCFQFIASFAGAGL